jgi:hypothetical protein
LRNAEDLLFERHRYLPRDCAHWWNTFGPFEVSEIEDIALGYTILKTDDGRKIASLTARWRSASPPYRTQARRSGLRLERSLGSSIIS